jgi:nitrogen fixation NifU-like protein
MQWCELFGLNSISAQSERPAEAAWRLAADAGRGVAARSRSRHTADMFSKAVLDHFQNPRGAGELPEATARVEVSNPACGDILQIAARVEAGHFAEVRFLARGCVTAMACGSWLAAWLPGKTLEQARALTPREISVALGELPPATYHGSQLACDALEALLASMR